MEKLIEQIAVSAVNLDSIKSRRFGVFCPFPIGLDDPRDFLKLQGTRGDEGFFRADETYVAAGLNRTWCHGQLTIQIQRVRNPPDVPQLKEHFPTLRMDGAGDFLPALHLLLRPDPGAVRVADALWSDRSGLTNDQAHAGALAIVFRHQVVRHATFARAAARERCHDHPICQFKRTNFDRSK